MQAFQMDLEKFEKLHAQVIGISSDSVETHEKFLEKYGLTFPLVSDGDGLIKRLYGRGRITYLIDKNGIIRFIQEGVPENKDFLKKLREIDSGTE
jgi:peroxiredoxin Q/BCP